jgi:hypothetical protein
MGNPPFPFAWAVLIPVLEGRAARGRNLGPDPPPVQTLSCPDRKAAIRIRARSGHQTGGANVRKWGRISLKEGPEPSKPQ